MIVKQNLEVVEVVCLRCTCKHDPTQFNFCSQIGSFWVQGVRCCCRILSENKIFLQQYSTSSIYYIIVILCCLFFLFVMISGVKAFQTSCQYLQPLLHWYTVKCCNQTSAFSTDQVKFKWVLHTFERYSKVLNRGNKISCSNSYINCWIGDVSQWNCIHFSSICV